jgi:N-glycosylase/DNA lyase
MKFTEISAADFNLAMTLDSGQVFHWEKAGDGFTGTIGDCPVYIEQRANLLTAWNSGDKLDGFKPSSLRRLVTNYFALDHPLADICASFPNDPIMNEARDFCRGLRIIRQPKWECLATFICSSMKQVAHIRQISLTLRRRFGDRRKIGDYVVYTFPPAQRIARATENDLRECALGYRAKNLLTTASFVASGECDLESWSALSDHDLRKKLRSLPGVGAKIANCVLLFAYERLRAFPIDVWIERVLRQQYFPRKKVTEPRLREFSEIYFGEHGGYAQQYLFHHARMASRRSRMARDSSTPLYFARNDKNGCARVTLRTSGVTRDSSTPKAFGRRNDEENSARMGKSKLRSGSHSRIRKTKRAGQSVVSTPGVR